MAEDTPKKTKPKPASARVEKDTVESRVDDTREAPAKPLKTEFHVIVGKGQNEWRIRYEKGIEIRVEQGEPVRLTRLDVLRKISLPDSSNHKEHEAQYKLHAASLKEGEIIRMDTDIKRAPADKSMIPYDVVREMDLMSPRSYPEGQAGKISLDADGKSFEIVVRCIDGKSKRGEPGAHVAALGNEPKKPGRGK